MIKDISCPLCSGRTICCDICLAPVDRCNDETDPGVLAVQARKKGYTTKPGKKASDPMLWVCGECKVKE